MVFRGLIRADVRTQVFQLRRNTDMSMRTIGKACGISWSSVRRILRQGIQGNFSDRKKPGRPPKLSVRQQRLLVPNIKKLRENNPIFSLLDLMKDSGVSARDVSERTVNRFLQRQGFHYLQTRKKGLMKKQDLSRRVTFCSVMQTIYSADVWTRKVTFYLDGVSFAFKRNPLEVARAPKTRIWRKRGEGLSFGCTAKGRKEGTGSTLAKFFVAITYGEGVILCESYDHLTGTFLAKFIEEHFNSIFVEANKNGSRLWLQDGDPSQNSSDAKRAMCNCNCDLSLIQIPPRSPDLNPIENFFHLVRCKLKSDALALNITKETLQEFKARIIRTIYSIPVNIINRTIASMPARLQQVIDSKGSRIKY